MREGFCRGRAGCAGARLVLVLLGLVFRRKPVQSGFHPDKQLVG